MECKIEIVNGPQDGQLFIIDKYPISIGRAEGNNIQIAEDPLVSRIHCTIYMGNENSIFISDLNSTNGTYVNKEILKSPILLKSSDKIYLGSTILRFMQ